VAQPQAQDPSQLRRRLSEIQGRLAAVDQQVASLKKRRKGLLVELQSISLEADRARVQADAARMRRDQTQGEVAAITARQEEIRQEIQRRRGDLRRQVRWMQALGPLGDLSLLSGLNGFQDFLAQSRYRTYLRNQQRRRLDYIQGLEREMGRKGEELRAALGRLGQEEEEARRNEQNLRHQEDRLQAFLEGIRQDESRQKEIQADLAEEALQLDRMLTQLLSKARPESFEGASPFPSLKGELPQPTPGSLAQGFGEHLHPRFHTRTLQSGLLIAGSAGAAVQAVAEGKVVYADIYQSFGPMVILDHGGGYFSIYTHLEGLTVSRGQILKPGESLGAVGMTVDGPRLGFEIRHQTQALDPNGWLKQRYRGEGEGRRR
jgi:septal ring factor EnvC (AmiA/AmiB activator)